jgi:LysR family transcriptional regulator, transcriptional activator of nhaA
MPTINYKHLHYFWIVAKAGGITRASKQLHITPQTISGQLSLFEQTLGELLFHRSGKHFELTEAGQMVLAYADEIFSLGQELQEALHHQMVGRPAHFRVGLTDAVHKSLAYRLLEPAFQTPKPPRIICREGKVTNLLAELAIHRLDIVIADSPMPPSLNVRGFSHLLGESGLSFFATQALAEKYAGHFPQRLDGAPLLLPGADVAVRPRLMRWLSDHKLHPVIAGEFDDSALMEAFGRAGTGIFCAPSAIASQIVHQNEAVHIGATDEVKEHFYAISIERKLTHPAVLAISHSARQELFSKR